jgi:ABC-type polysaccharide/polyol phosphate export permease
MSGVFFTAARFPAFMQPIVKALPLTAAISAMRANMLQGVSVGHMLPLIANLLFWFFVPFAVALRIFRWR